MAVADGDAGITASIGKVSAAAPVLVRAGGHAVHGVVTESAPTEDRPIPGAVVTVVGGVYADTSATTDASGRFTLSDVAGILRLRVTHPEFEEHLVPTESPMSLVVRLVRTVTFVTETAQWEADSPSSYHGTARFVFRMHDSGPVSVKAGASFFAGESMPSCLEIREEATSHA